MALHADCSTAERAAAPPARAALDASLESLWSALRARQMDTGDAAALRPHVRRVASAGRAEGLLPEQLLGEVKRSWYALPEVRRGHTPPAYFTTDDQLGRVVSLCIEAYFRGCSDD